MNREDIIRIAREAGIVVTGEAIWRLCELVATAEREACAKVCDWWNVGHCAAAIRARGDA
jgi:hypothetical protein